MLRNCLSHLRASVPRADVPPVPSGIASGQDTITFLRASRYADHVRSYSFRLRSNRFVPLRVVLTLLVCLVGTGRANAQFDLATIYNFGSQPNDGQNPSGGLTLGTDGLFYGTTLRGGTNGSGVIYTITSTGDLTTLYNFGSRPNDGIGPWAPLTQGTDGAFYGGTSGGGGYGGFTLFGAQNGYGTLFKITPDGDYTQLYRFGSQPGDGYGPWALTQGTDGAFYGTTYSGGIYGTVNTGGTIFKITPAGVYTLLYSFGTQPNDGNTPFAGLTLGTDSTFYGTTQYGGAYNNGTIFKITSSGTYTTLYSFGSQPNDGNNPFAGLTLGTDGLFYGTTAGGGVYNSGTIFKITSSGVLTTLYSFGTQPNDGSVTYGALTQGSDGAFYGATANGGAYYAGTIYKITSAGAYTQLYNFGYVSFNSAYPNGSLTLGPDGLFYGTAQVGGYYEGAVYRLSPETIQLLLSSPQMSGGGQSVTGIVTLVNPAPGGGAVISLSTNNPGVTVPATITVPAGQTTLSFPITTSPVLAVTAVIVTANYLEGSTTAEVLVQPAVPSALTFTPSSVTAGTSAMATVTFAGQIPAPGLTVQISTDSPLASAPTSVVIGPSGSATFPVATKGVRYPTTVNVTVTFNQQAVTAPLTILPAPVALAGISATPTSFPGGQSVVGTVTINTVTANNVPLTLTSNNPDVQVPGSVTVRGGATSANFVIRSSRVSKPTPVTITASDTHTTRSVDLMLLP